MWNEMNWMNEREKKRRDRKKEEEESNEGKEECKVKWRRRGVVV